MQQIDTSDREAFAWSLRRYRRATLLDFAFNILHAFGDFDFSLPHLATLLMLDEEGEFTIKQVAQFLGRSVSATSRLLDQLVERGLVSRREDERDRRAKRVAITEEGRTFIAILERRRADLQLEVLEYLSAEERADVIRAMVLLAEASTRRNRHEHLESRATGE